LQGTPHSQDEGSAQDRTFFCVVKYSDMAKNVTCKEWFWIFWGKCWYTL